MVTWSDVIGVTRILLYIAAAYCFLSSLMDAGQWDQQKNMYVSVKMIAFAELCRMIADHL